MMTKTKTYPTLSNRNVYSYNNSHLTYQEILFFQNKSTTIPSIDPNFAIKTNYERWFTKMEMLLSNILINIVLKYEEIENLSAYLEKIKGYTTKDINERH